MAYTNRQRKIADVKRRVAEEEDGPPRKSSPTPKGRTKVNYPTGEATRQKVNYPTGEATRSTPSTRQKVNYPTGEATRKKMEYPVIRPGTNSNRDSSFRDYMQGRRQGFNPYAAGQKRYGPSGRSAPNVGPTGSPEGYDIRERKNNAKRNAMLRKMKATQSGRQMSPDALRRKSYGG